MHLEPEVTIADLAGQIGCSVQKLSEVIRAEFSTNFDGLLDRRRARYARDLLLEGPNDANSVYAVGIEAGFRSFEQFNSSFIESFGVSPQHFVRQHRDKSQAADQA